MTGNIVCHISITQLAACALLVVLISAAAFAPSATSQTLAPKVNLISGAGVYGSSAGNNSQGVYGASDNGVGVRAYSENGIGLVARVTVGAPSRNDEANEGRARAA